MAAAPLHEYSWEAYRRGSQDSQGSFVPSSLSGHRPGYQHESTMVDEPPDFDPTSSASHALSNGSEDRVRGSRELGYSVGTPEGIERELLIGEDARGSSARRRSEDAGPAAGYYLARQGSSASLQREGTETARPSTPRRDRVDQADEEELTPRAAAGKAATATEHVQPRPRTSSLTSTSKPLHTPPTLLPAGARTSPLDYSPSRSSSRAQFDHLAGSSSSAHLNTESYPSRSASPSSSSAYSRLSFSEDDWATSHLDESGTSPPRSPLLADIMRQARQPSLAQAAGGVRESRPVSEFDVAAFYTSDGSMPASPAIPAGFVELPQEVGSPPLPPVPPKEPLPPPLAEPEPPVREASPPMLTQSSPPPPVSQPLLAFQPAPPASLSGNPASSSPSSAIPTVAPLPPSSTATSKHLSPDSAETFLTASDRPQSRASSVASTTSRPPSRGSSRSPGPQPPRPPRRMQSNLSLMSARSAEPEAPTSASVPPPPFPAAAEPAPPPSVPVPAPEAAHVPAPEPLSDLSYPRTRPRGLSNVQAGSIKQRTPPNIPEKSRRRTSQLLSGPGGSRLSTLTHSRSASLDLKAPAEMGRREDEVEKSGLLQEGAADGVQQPPNPASPSGSSTYAANDEGYLRDSFYQAYAGSPLASPETVPCATFSPSPSPSASKISSHFREATSIEDSPVPSPVPPVLAELPSSRVGHLRTDSGVSNATGETSSVAYHDAHSATGSPVPSSMSFASGSGPTAPAAAPNVPDTVAQGAAPSTSAGLDVRRAESPSDGRSRSSSRADAKARAAAFIADLKRAKAEAAKSAGNSPVPDAVPTADREEAETRTREEEEDTLVLSAAAGSGRRDTLIISAPAPAAPMSPTVVISPSQEDSAMLPSLPSSPPAPDSPGYGLHPRHRSASTVKSVSSSPLPPFPPPSEHPQPTKRPSQSSIFSAASLSKSQPASSSTPSAWAMSPPPLPRSTTLSSISPLPGSHPPPLFRRRPLPMAIQAHGELKAARTPRERAKIYAEKINELARERSRLEEWIGSVRNTSTMSGRMSAPTSPVALSKLPRSARQDASTSSTATFAPRADSYRAREITSTASSFSSRDLYPKDAPFPGVLGLTSSKHGSSSNSSSGGSHGKHSLFGGFGRSSLGRRASKREHHPPGGSLTSSSASTLRSQISAPIPFNSPPPSLSAASGARHLAGPRMPHSQPIALGNNTHRASFDSRTSSPSTSPVMDRTVSRASFSYGTGPSSTVGRAYVLSSSAPSVAVAVEDADPEEEEKLDRLAAILPQAEKADLRHALAKAGGDDVLAISVYLSGEAMKR
ncbi:hypothetical protein JCM10213v2_000203 [Rhodosporidiobolus nylandii]